MKRSILVVAAGMVIAGIAVPAQASVQGSSFTEISNFIIKNTVTGLPVTAGVGGQISTAAPSNSATTIADLVGVGSDSHNNLAGLDALQAWVATGAAVQPAENTFPAGAPPISLLSVPVYAIADTEPGPGAAVTFLPGPVTTGAMVDTLAQLRIDSSDPAQLGSSAGTATSATTFLTVTTPITLVLDFDAFVGLELDQTAAPPPTGITVSGSASFSTTLTGSGVITVGGVVSPSASFAPAALNTGILSNSTPGTATTYYVGTQAVPMHFTSPVIGLGAGTYTFAVTQGNAVTIDSTVPEPATLLIWTLFGGTGIWSFARYRSIAK